MCLFCSHVLMHRNFSILHGKKKRESVYVSDREISKIASSKAGLVGNGPKWWLLYLMRATLVDEERRVRLILLTSSDVSHSNNVCPIRHMKEGNKILLRCFTIDVKFETKRSGSRICANATGGFRSFSCLKIYHTTSGLSFANSV